MFRTIALGLGLAAALCTSAFAHGYEVGDLEVGHPWSMETPPNARVAAGYASVTNGGDASDRLVEVRSAAAARVEIHEMEIDSAGVMTMRELEGGLEIPAGETVELAPGGLHLMFIEPIERHLDGQTFPGTLVFENAGEVEVEFAVHSRANAPAAEGHSHH